MEKSESLNELATALSAAQAEIEDAEKSRSNPAFRSKYADLGAVVDACKPALTKHGLAFSQVFEPSEAGVLRLTTLLLHQSGQWLAGTITMPLAKVDPQGYGSAATYARRYGLAAIVGVCPEDDDGNAASASRQQAQQAESRGDQRAAQQPRPSPGRERAQAAIEAQEQPLATQGASPAWLEARDVARSLMVKLDVPASSPAEYWGYVGRLAHKEVRGWGSFDADELGALVEQLRFLVTTKTGQPELDAPADFTPAQAQGA